MLHRVRDHVATHNWFAVAIDLAIVVIGVFLGMQVSNWNAARLERGETREYQAQIIDNLRANEREIANGARYYRQVRGHALAALTTMEGGAPRDETFLIHSYQASQYWPLRMERSAYDEMIASGTAKNFGDAAIRRQLSAFYAGLGRFEATAVSSTAYRERIRRALLFSVQQRIRERCNDVYKTSPNGSQNATLPERCTPELPAPMVARAVARLGETSELDQDLTRHMGDLEQKIALFDRMLSRARLLRLDLERMDV